MNLQQQLVFCKQCENRAFSDSGIICSLTKRKPEFETTCDHFSKDASESQRLALKAHDSKTKNSENGSVWIYIGIALIAIRIIIKVIKN